MKIRMPRGWGVPEGAVRGWWRAREGRMAVVKYLKRASGSVVGEGESKREKVWRIGRPLVRRTPG